MTDGSANQVASGADVTYPEAENITLAEAVAGVNAQNIMYHTIGIGDGADSYNPVFLQQLADTNGGRFYNTTDNGTLQAIYQSLAQDIGTGVVSGLVFNDVNTNKVYDAGDQPLPFWTVNALGQGFDAPLSTQTNASGNYQFTGLCSKPFIFTQSLRPGWYQTTDDASYTVDIVSGNTYENINFGNAVGFTISGRIVNDFDKDLNYAAPDTLNINDNTLLFVGPVTKNVTTANGIYTSGAVPPGTYTVTLSSPLGTGYRMTYPLNGPPPSFQVTVGSNCNTNAAKGAICE